MQANISMDQRLIVALDVPTHEEAISLVRELDNISFFKVGLELLLAGSILDLVQQMQQTRASMGGVFVDLKLSGDIPNTIARFIERCLCLDIRFLTLDVPAVTSKTTRTISAARAARNGSEFPQLLMVPLYSSLDAEDLNEHGSGPDPDLSPSDYIVERGGQLLEYGCDGLIVSGEAIRACREKFPNVCLVSPGIRPKGCDHGDHKRYTTPAEAIRYGADYLVVGRPILNAANRRQAAQDIIDEMEQASAG
jgi:orotidine-5'-phosphate decarboxylase